MTTASSAPIGPRLPETSVGLHQAQLAMDLDPDEVQRELQAVESASAEVSCALGLPTTVPPAR